MNYESNSYFNSCSPFMILMELCDKSKYDILQKSDKLSMNSILLFEQLTWRNIFGGLKFNKSFNKF